MVRIMNLMTKLITSVIVAALFVGGLCAIGFVINAIIQFSSVLFFGLVFGAIVACVYSSIDDAKAKG